jgi:hypothetical protein
MGSARRVGTNEDIHTYGDGTRNYTSLQTWEDAHTVDCVATTTSHVLECYDDAASFNDYVNIAGATTDSTYFRIIRPAAGQGHDGTPNNGVYFSSTYSAGDTFINAEAYSQIQDIIVTTTINTNANRNSFSSGIQYVAFVGCMAFNGVNSYATRNVWGFLISNSGPIALNCLAHNNDGHGFSLAGYTASKTISAYNCIATNNGLVGFNMSGSQATGNIVLTNCLASNNAGGDFASVATNTEVVTYCASGDTTADDWAGAGNRISQTFTFVNSGGDDFHLASNDAGAIDLGTDLSADATYAFNDDIDKQSRSGSWDIGFDEYCSPLLKSVSSLGSNANVMTG